MRHIRIAAAAAALLSLAAADALAQAWPSKPIRFITGVPPGGPSDFVSRLVAEGLTGTLGQAVFVENRPGGGTTIGQAAVASAAPDGYTIGLISNAPTTAAPLLQKLTYDASSFTPIARIADVPLMFLVHPQVNAKTVPELISLIKANPGKYNYASDGVGSSTHLGFELFKIRTGGLDVTHIPMKGTAEILTGYGSGEIHMSITGVQAALPHVRDGRIRGLAVTGASRLAQLPDLPTLAETVPALREVDLGSWFVVAGPAGLPNEIRDRLSRDINAFIQRPDIRKRLEDTGGLTVVPGGPAESAALIARSAAQWKETIATAKISVSN